MSLGIGTKQELLRQGEEQWRAEASSASTVRWTVQIVRKSLRLLRLEHVEEEIVVVYWRDDQPFHTQGK